MPLTAAVYRPPLAHRLSESRKAAGLSREAAAVALDKSCGSIVAYETGAVTPPVPVLIALAAVYNTTVASLLGEGAGHAA